MFNVDMAIGVGTMDAVGAAALVMSIGNQKFGIPRKNKNQIGIWYLS